MIDQFDMIMMMIVEKIVIKAMMIVNTIDGNKVFGPCENQQVDHHELSMLLFFASSRCLASWCSVSVVSDIKVVFKAACASISSHCPLAACGVVAY